MLEAIRFSCKNVQNIEILDVFKILITLKLLKCPKDPFVRSALICIFDMCHYNKILLTYSLCKSLFLFKFDVTEFSCLTPIVCDK